MRTPNYPRPDGEVGPFAALFPAMGQMVSVKQKDGSTASKRRRVSEAIEIAKDYRTDVYWEGEVVWRYSDWEKQSGAKPELAAAV